MATTATAQHPASEDATSSAKPAAEKPLATFRSGSVSAAVYGKKRTLKNGTSATFADISLRKSFKTEDGIARLRKLGAEPAGGSPDDMQRYVLAEAEKWGKVAKFAGIKPE